MNRPAGGDPPKRDAVQKFAGCVITALYLFGYFGILIGTPGVGHLFLASSLGGPVAVLVGLVLAVIPLKWLDASHKRDFGTAWFGWIPPY